MELHTHTRTAPQTTRPRPDADRAGGYAASLKSAVADELLNSYLIRPLAWLLVKPLLRTPTRPEAIVILNIALACLAAGLFFLGTRTAVVAAACLLLAKILFDAVDGQLARAKGLVSRLGRFLDSLADFYTNLLVFGAIGLAAARQAGDPGPFVLWVGAFWTMTLQCSFFNYYLVAHQEAAGGRPASRTDESLRREDLEEPRRVLALQRLYLVTYGWQDRLMRRLDRRLGADALAEERRGTWYTEPVALRLSSFLGLGTLLTPLAVLALLDHLDLYLFFIFGPCNFILFATIVYRRLLARRLLREK